VNSSHPVSRLLSELLGRRVGRHFRSRHLPPIDVASPPLATQRDGTLVDTEKQPDEARNGACVAIRDQDIAR
jgi:hypothetical protein